MQNCLFHNITALETALEVRKNPQKYLESAELQALSGKLGNAIQQYADVLEKELKPHHLLGCALFNGTRHLLTKGRKGCAFCIKVGHYFHKSTVILIELRWTFSMPENRLK